MTIRQRWKQTTIAKKSLVITSVLVAFGTLFYAAAAAVQVYIMRQSSAETTCQIGQITAAAERIATSAETSTTNAETALKKTLEQGKAALDASIEASRLDQRAWIVLPRFVLNNDPIGNDSINISLLMVNSGKTVAKKTISKSGASVWRAVEPPRPDWSMAKTVSVSDIPPGNNGLEINAPLDNRTAWGV